MKYTVNIKAADFKDGLFGTGFFGEDFSSVEELKAIFRKYGPKKNVVTKITISSAETTSAIKEFGNNLAAKGQNINIFSLAAIAKKDKFKDIVIYYLPGGWYDDKGVFKFILEKGEKIVPQYGKKLTDILRELGVQL